MQGWKRVITPYQFKDPRPYKRIEQLWPIKKEPVAHNRIQSQQDRSKGTLRVE